MDQVLAGNRYVALFGDLEIPPSADLVDALATIASAGPHTRLALRPQAGKRVWNHDLSTSIPVHQIPDAVVDDGSAAVLQYVRRRPGDRCPLEVHLGRRVVALDVDHGLGDGRFAIELISALFALVGGQTAPWVDSGRTRLAMPRALVRTLVMHPTRARMAWRHAGDLRSSLTDCSDAGEYVSWTPSEAVSVAHVAADAESTVEEWRRANSANAGSAAVWLYILREALCAAGLEMTDKVMVAFDCRRYLPPGSRAAGNFIFGVDIPLAVNESLPTVAARLRARSVSGVPLAAMAAVSARGLVSARRKPTSPVSRLVGAPVDLMYSDLGNVTLLDNAPWCGEQYVTGLLDPAGPSGVTVLNARTGSARRLSISFHDNVIDRRIIDMAAVYMSDPLRFLTPDALTGSGGG